MLLKMSYVVTYGRSGFQYSKTVGVQYVPYACISADARRRPASGREIPIPTPGFIFILILERRVIHSVFSYVRRGVVACETIHGDDVVTW